jgi:maltose-binding protein MalE
VALLPSLQETGAPPAPYVQSMVVSVNARVGALNAHTQHAARDVLQYLVSEEAQQLLLLAGKQPTRSTLDLHGETPVFTIARLFRQQAHSGQPMPNSRIMNDIVRDELVRMQTSVLRGLVIPSEAVVRTDNILHERLQEEHGFAP